jgi:hypothetical protein
LSIAWHKEYKYCCVAKFAVHYISMVEQRKSANEGIPTYEEIMNYKTEQMEVRLVNYRNNQSAVIPRMLLRRGTRQLKGRRRI